MPPFTAPTAQNAMSSVAAPMTRLTSLTPLLSVLFVTTLFVVCFISMEIPQVAVLTVTMLTVWLVCLQLRLTGSNSYPQGRNFDPGPNYVSIKNTLEFS
jgi:hypothetical protein